jgi:hypothetical protein
MTPTSNDSSLVYATATPDVSKLIEEYRLCAPFSGYTPRLSSSDDVRYCRWPNQSADGKRHGTDEEPAQPFDGASDLREYLADDVIGEGVDLDVLSFWRGILDVKAVGAEDLELSGDQTRLVRWLVFNRMFNRLVDEVEHAAQWRRHYGWFAFRVTWEQEVQLRSKEMQYEDIVKIAAAFAQQDPNSPFAALDAMVLNPNLDDESAELLKQIYTEYVKASTADIFGGEVPKLPKGRYKAWVRELRESQKIKIPCPHMVRNEPSIVARKPFEEIFFRPETTDIQCARVFEKEFIDEVELRSRVLTEGYDEEWVDRVATYKGYYSTFSTPEDRSPSGLNTDLLSYPFRTINTRSNLIEILHVYQRQLDENGVPGIYRTVIHCMVAHDTLGKPLYATHTLLDYQHGQMPYIIGRFERPTRRIVDSRGVPDRVWCEQRNLKVQQDAIIDNTSMATCPSILEPMGYESHLAKLGKAGGMSGLWPQYKPFGRIPYRPGMEPKFMERPAAPTTSFEMWDRINEKVDRRFGRISEKIPPTLTQLKQQRQVNDFLQTCRQAFMQALALTHQFMPEDVYERVTGSKKPAYSADEILNSYDLILTCDVREFDTDYLKQKLEAFKNLVLTLDRNNTIDIDRVVAMFSKAIDPSLAREAIRSGDTGIEKLHQKVINDVALMFQGNELPYSDEVDPTAGHQIEMAKKIIAENPLYMQALQNPRIQAVLENWEKNKLQSVKQVENRQIGRTGVKPVGQY